MTPPAPSEDVYTIAVEVFSAMVDGDVGLLLPWQGDVPRLEDPITSWVDLHGAAPGRAALVTESATAQDLARALLGLADGQPVSEADLVDALGEVANVVGGNLKSLLPVPGRLTMPAVARAAPVRSGSRLVSSTPLAWRGRALLVEVWAFPGAPVPGARPAGAHPEEGARS